ncbi:glutaminyl-peptide cyclotransferase-like [Liolophura sinensis]|uniref:glutaminyl-peptide cyclotransferase-like n=1 Tax=Liolophura sinensis TaxID=3198878 RepID=UPI0031598956
MVKQRLTEAMVTWGLLQLMLVLALWTAPSQTKKVSPRFKDYSICSMRKLTDLTKTLREDRDFWFHLLTPMLTVRVSGSPENRRVQEHITSVLSNPDLQTRWVIEKDTFTDQTPEGPKEFTNIVASQNPQSPKVLVLACHFDSKFFRNMEFIGATDSAVPCAMLLDIAVRLDGLLQKKKNADVSLQLVFFDGEEAFRDWTATDSLYGSRHLAQQWKTRDANGSSRLDSIEALILLDLIGADKMKFWDFFPDSTSKLFQKFKKIEKLMRDESLVDASIPIMFSNQRPLSSIQDDHVPFMAEGVPILHLISYPFPDEWHQKTDNASHLNDKKIFYFLHIFRVFVSSYLKLPIMCR